MKVHSILLLIEKIENWLIFDHISAKKLSYTFLGDTLYLYLF